MVEADREAGKREKEVGVSRWCGGRLCLKSLDPKMPSSSPRGDLFRDFYVLHGLNTRPYPVKGTYVTKSCQFEWAFPGLSEYLLIAFFFSMYLFPLKFLNSFCLGNNDTLGRKKFWSQQTLV